MFALKFVPYLSRWTGVGVTKAPFVNFSVSKIFDLTKVTVIFFNHIHIWQVSPQLRCGDTYQIQTWYLRSNVFFDNAEKTENNEPEEIGLVTPTPGVVAESRPSYSWVSTERCHILRV